MLTRAVEVDTRFSRQVEVPGRAPWDGAAAAAAAAWQGCDRYNPIVANPVVDYAAAAAAANTLAQSWRTPDPLAAPYYQPGTTTLRGLSMPVEATSAEAPVLSTLNAMAHGPSLFVAASPDEPALQPLPQYAPQGDLLAEPLYWDVVPRVACRCACPYPNSMAQLFMEPYNAVKVRTMLVEAGLVELSPALAKLDASNACSCAILTSGYDDFVAFGMQFVDTPAWIQPEPIAQVNFYNTMYVTRVIASAREQVTMASVANYARAAEGRAYIQDRPAAPEVRGGVASSAHLPLVLPGTECEVAPTDELFATYYLTAPIASAANRAAFECITGIPVNTPLWRGDAGTVDWQPFDAYTLEQPVQPYHAPMSSWAPISVFESACDNRVAQSRTAAYIPFTL